MKKDAAQHKNERRIKVPLMVGPRIMEVSTILPGIEETACESDVKDLQKNGLLI
ncbi:MAG: hypothetical protein PHQ34_11515 [Methanothrix sp.]|nr:hypothetical protein [Methanothrix sp.]